jgi:ferritin-like metal-binding protein YciE
MIALPMQKASTMHTITSSRSPYGSCSFNGRPHFKCLRTRIQFVVEGNRSLDCMRMNVPYVEPGALLIVVCAQSSREHTVAKKPKKLEDLFHETLKDIYFAENKILKTLPKMAKAAQSKELRAAFVQHERETKGQVKRLDRVFKIIGKPARGKTCAAINGITEEGSEIMKDFKGMPALDAGLLASAQAVEHYEISRYGTLSTWAEELGYDEAVDLLEATLQEEKNTDKTLTGIAKSVVNIEAEQDEAEEE